MRVYFESSKVSDAEGRASVVYATCVFVTGLLVLACLGLF